MYRLTIHTFGWSSPLFYPFALLGIFDHSMVAVAIGDVKLARSQHGNVGGFTEVVLIAARLEFHTKNNVWLSAARLKPEYLINNIEMT